jgi:MoaA/NifB/PqqE/SkfB family radical SAM enzyme
MPFASVSHVDAEETRLQSLCYVLGYRCPLRCDYCCNPDHHDRSDLPSSSAERLLLEWLPFRVTLTGGEPLLYRSDVRRLSRLLRDRGRRVVLPTSGIGLGNPEDLESIDEFDVSLHGASREAYARRRGFDGYDRCIAAIQTLVRQGRATSVNFVVAPDEVDVLPDVAALVADLGVSRFRIETIHDMGAARIAHSYDWQRLLAILETVEATRGLEIWWPTVGPKLTPLLQDGMILLERSGNLYHYSADSAHQIGRADDVLTGELRFPERFLSANRLLHAFPDDDAKEDFREWCRRRA